MKEDRAGSVSGAKTSNIAASEVPSRERCMTARRKQEAVLCKPGPPRSCASSGRSDLHAVQGAPAKGGGPGGTMMLHDRQCI
jgi:hypothetical protein